MTFQSIAEATTQYVIAPPAPSAWTPEGWVLIIGAIGTVIALFLNNRKQNQKLSEISVNVDGNLSKMRDDLARALSHVSSLTGGEGDKALADKAAKDAAIPTVPPAPTASLPVAGTTQPVAIEVVGEARIGPAEENK